MSHCKRALPKDESAHFRLKSNLKSWEGIREGSYMREQENKIAFFNFKAKGEAFARNIRRDDFDCGSDGFIAETNKIVCNTIEHQSYLLFNGYTPVNERARREHRYWVGEYVKSLRKLGNHCVICRSPLKVKKSVVRDVTREVEFCGNTYLVASEIVETIEEFKERLKWRKSVQLKYKAYGKTLTRRHKFSTRAIGKYRAIGETKFSAHIGANELFYLAQPNGMPASVEWLLKFKPVVVREFSPRIENVPNADCVCDCKK